MLYVVSSSLSAKLETGLSRTTSGKDSFILSASRLRSITGFFITPFTNNEPWFAKRTLFATPLLTVAVLFTFTNCGLGSGGKSGDAPWLLLAGGINGHTASVDDASNGGDGSSGGSGSGGSALVPVVGMYFLHPDHLGSITMITDGRGNVISGGNNGGKSHISYTPYGSIHRTDSSGPDITRFKFTGQEEDKESSLLYYKARYYDPMIGRFLQADNLTVNNDIYGQNQYMYVKGSPVNYKDDSGNWCSKNTLGAILFVMGGSFGPVLTALGGVYKNYTGGGGSCSEEGPKELEALFTLFSAEIVKTKDPGEQALKVFALNYYYEFETGRGRPTFINSTSRRDLAAILVYDAFKNPENFRRDLFVWLLMTHNVLQPAKGVDQGSYWHDKYGSRPFDPDNRTANKQWMKNSWQRARGPGDIVASVTGTILFSIANFVSDVTHVKPARYGCKKGCSFNGSF